jgi:hypothetical protein
LVNSLSWTVLTQLLVCAADSVLLIIDVQERLAAAMNLMVRECAAECSIPPEGRDTACHTNIGPEQYLSLATRYYPIRP